VSAEDDPDIRRAHATFLVATSPDSLPFLVRCSGGVFSRTVDVIWPGPLRRIPLELTPIWTPQLICLHIQQRCKAGSQPACPELEIHEDAGSLPGEDPTRVVESAIRACEEALQRFESVRLLEALGLLLQHEGKPPAPRLLDVFSLQLRSASPGAAPSSDSWRLAVDSFVLQHATSRVAARELLERRRKEKHLGDLHVVRRRLDSVAEYLAHPRPVAVRPEVAPLPAGGNKTASGAGRSHGSKAALSVSLR